MTNSRQATERAIEYMALKPGMPIRDIRIDKVFIGSCTNSRIEDFRLAASFAKGKKVAGGVHAMVVPGSGLVKQQAEQEDWIASSRSLASNGGRRDAACVWP